MSKAESFGRNRPDACPGALQVHEAADGPLARVRVPGGVIEAAQAQVLATSATELGSGMIELTSRGNVQVRGLSDPAAFAARIAAAGLLPSVTHERVRNIVASPFTDRALIDALDQALCARPALAELPGRFLFSIEDIGLEADVTYVNRRLLLAGHDAGLDVPEWMAVPLMLDAAEAFLRLRGTEWRIAELDDGPARIAALLGGPSTTIPPDSPNPDSPHPPGRDDSGAARTSRPSTPSHDERVLGRSDTPASGSPQPLEPTEAESAGTIRPISRDREVLDGPDAARANPSSRELGVLFGGRAVQALVPLGKPTPAQLLALADVADEVRLTPWRTFVVRDPADADEVERRLAAAGLVTDSDSPWAGVTACIGRPGCGKALANVHADATAWVLGRIHAPATPVHWSGCERRCGLPRGRVLQMVATADGYDERLT
ncbi:precorrin-3B synthase [Thermopolyspora sp. NPDC052614]|uniref:precorrin-3B synthase n=1 Tax=Thermopolyspora sp. NPDC052614 TaxID=3155682 RepID=UPI003446107C